MSIPADVLRELGCEHRTFRTAKGALLWYVDQMSAKLRVTRALDEERVRLSVAEREKVRATIARIQPCLEPTHPTDVQFRGRRVRGLLPLEGHLVRYLVRWYEADYGDGAALARQAQMTRWSFDRRCMRTEHVMRIRMESAGLIEEET